MVAGEFVGPGAAQLEFLFIQDHAHQQTCGVEVLAVAGGTVDAQQRGNGPAGTALMGRKTFERRRHEGHQMFAQKQG